MADESFDVSSTGRFRNTDVPDEDERRKSSVKKKKRSGVSKKERLAKLSEEEEAPKKRKKKTKSLPSVVEEVPAKKKKKSKLDEPATVTLLAKLDRKKEKALAALEELESPEHTDIYDARYKKMFNNIDVITEALEEKMKEGLPSSKDVYALSTLYSQMREIINDIRSSRDVEAQMQMLENEACSAFLKLVGQSLVYVLMSAKKEISIVVKDKDVRDQLNATLDQLIVDQSKEVQQGYQAMRTRIREVLA